MLVHYLMQQETSTICAISTPAGNGAIAMLRMSGKDALAITKNVFYPASGKINIKPNTNILGTIKNESKELDDAIVSYFKAPHSYTGEDMVEITCHGSVYIQQQLLQLLIDHGANLARPGEFTMRAFLNGKLDLSQSEAVADLIASSSKTAHTLAMKQMRGGVSNEIQILRDKLLNFTSLLELELDFSEEDVEFADKKELGKLLSVMMELIKKLVDSFQTGNAIKNGVPVSIIGKTNVGKSTLLNLLLKEEKAIVSDIAGTTRDAIEDTISIQGVLFRFIDTAGLRETKDTIETMGIEKTLQKVKQARVILFMADINDSLREITGQIKQVKVTDEQEIIVILNKSDTLSKKQIQDTTGSIQKEIRYPVLPVSAKKHDHIEILIEQLLQSAHLQSIEQNDVVITNARHYEALKHALEALIRAEKGLKDNLSSDFIAMDIRQVLHYLGEITGEITTDEILGNIFSKFCIGK